MCRVLGYRPSLGTFYRFYMNSISNGWMSFSRRGPTPCCLLKFFDSLKNWNDHFFWIDASICPISFPWHTGASILKDPLPFDNRVNAELLALLDHHRTIIRRYPETFLCVVGLSHSFDDVLMRPTLLKDDGSDMGLLDFVKSSDPFKVKTGERTLVEGEIPLNDETVNMTVPPSAEIVQIVDHTIVDEVKEHVGKKKRRVVFEELPIKRLRADVGMASEAVNSTRGKSLSALKRLELQSRPQGVGSSYVPPPVEEFVSSSVTPTPEPDAPEDSGSGWGVEDIAAASTGGVGVPGDNAKASTSVPYAASPIDDFYNSQTVETATDHITRPAYWVVLRNLSPVAFLDAFNINSAQHTCMVSELRLRYEHEIMTREKFQKKFTDNCAVVKQRDAKITALKTRLERAEREAVEVVSPRGRVSEMEAGVTVKSQEVETLGKQNVELLSKVSALESERGELNRHAIKLGGNCERLRKEVVGEAKLREEFKSFQDDEACRFEQKSAELNSRIADVRREMDNDLYPHMFTTIAGCRWNVDPHWARLFLWQSDKCRSALGKVISLAVDQWIQEGLEADELESLKDSPLVSIMSALVLKDAQGNVDSTPELQHFQPSLDQVTIPIYSESGSVSGEILLSEISSLVLSGDGGSTTQPPIVQAHDDLFDTSVLDGAGGA
ncbi:hypothetical protein Tco_0663464 [Tanacetum coccineum]